MKKMGIKWFFIFALMLLMVTGVLAVTEWKDAPIYHGTLGVADTSLVGSILQITTGDPATQTSDVKDWVPCWGVNPWSRDSTWIVYQSQMGSGSGSNKMEICIIKADGTGYQRLTNNSVCDSHGNFTRARTRDKIVFQREASGENSAEIWIMDKDGSNQQSLTQAHGGAVVEGGCEQKPVISPNGNKIAFRACTGDSSDDESGQLWVMNIDGTNPVKVSGTLTKNTKHSWSPDSNWILFSSEIDYPINGTVSRIYKVRSDGSSLTMLSADVDTDDCENWAAWSPDGKWISYHRRTDNPGADDFSEIWMMNNDGTGKQLLVGELAAGLDAEGEDICGPHSWAPRSDRIVFKQSLSSSDPLYIIDIKTRKITQLTENYQDGRMWWSPDGTKILFKERSTSGTRDEGQFNYDLLVLNMNTYKHGDDGNSYTTTSSSSNSHDGYCFIATAAFGSPLAGQVEILRQFRDKYLLTNALGKKFVAWYYSNGPIAANWIKDKPFVKVAVRVALYPLIGFSLLLLSGYLPFVTVGLLLSTLLFLRIRPKKLIAK